MAVSIPFLDELGDDGSDAPAVRFLREALMRPLVVGTEILCVSLAAPVEALEKVLRLLPRQSGVLFSSPAGTRLVGGGVAAQVKADGPDRFRILAEGIDEVWSRVAVRSQDDAPFTPVFIGAASFVATSARSAPWTHFEPNTFILPRWTYRRDGTSSARLVCAVRRDQLQTPGFVDALVNEAAQILGQLDHESPTSVIQTDHIDASAIQHLPPAAWGDYIGRIKGALATKEFEKLVAARTSVLRMPGPSDDIAVMARLFAGYPACTHFALRRASATFFGATPETLFRKTRNRFETEALAGTIRVSDDLWADSAESFAQLQASQKDRIEHAVVVRAICQSLWPLASKTEHPDFPEARRLRHLLHLRTPIKGELREGVRPFDLVSALHPTPAIGGFPQRPAVDWLARNDPMERGLYCGVFGWLDADGDCEFSVSIRCGVVTDEWAWAYAGAGIVSDSVAELEYNETSAKMVPLMRALGART